MSTVTVSAPFVVPAWFQVVHETQPDGTVLNTLQPYEYDWRCQAAEPVAPPAFVAAPFQLPSHPAAAVWLPYQPPCPPLQPRVRRVLPITRPPSSVSL